MNTPTLNREQRRAAIKAKRHAPHQAQPDPNLINIVKNPVWRALSVAPMEQPKQTDMNIDIHQAFRAIITGHGTLDDVNSLAYAANIGLVLAERGHGPELLDNIIEAQHALVRVLARHQQGKAIGFDGAGTQCIRDLLDTHSQQMQQAGKSEVSDALLEVYARGKTNSMKVPA